MAAQKPETGSGAAFSVRSRPVLLRLLLAGGAGIAFLTLAGCVSPVAPEFADAQAFQSETAGAELTDEPAVMVLSAEVTAGMPARAVPADGAEESAAEAVTDAAAHPATDPRDYAAADIVAADVIPEPAPRDGAGNPRLMEGVALAFASDDTQEAATASARAVSTSAGLQQAEWQVERETAASPAPAAPKSLFETLFQRHRQQQPQQRPMRVASLGTVPYATPLADIPGGDSATGQDNPLPGVKGSHELFGLADEDHEEAEANYDVAAVGGFGRLSPNGLRLQTDHVEVGCLKPGLVAILKQVERHFGRAPVVTSGYRSPSGNRRAGGARKSLHMQCMAADIQVEGVSKFDLAKYLRGLTGRGGVGTYCRTRSVHIDIGEEREWHYPCRRIKKRAS